jgi:adenosine deaminase
MSDAVDWRAEPKVELHLHLEGAAPPALTRALAARKGLALGDDPYAWGDFSGFLGAYDRVSSVYRTAQDERALAEAVLRECAAHGVIYAEITISPDHAGRHRWAEHLAAIGEGADAAEAATGIVARFIVTCVRRSGPEGAEAVARLALATPDARVVGFGMAGDERLHAPADFARAFAIAREGGLRLTAHAGEFAGPESVRGALDHLRVERVGHGVRAAEDPELVRRLAAEGVTLEVCPGSNVALGVVPSLAAHPIAALDAAGVPVTVSTDDPPFFGTDMTVEYAGLAETFGWGRDKLRALSRTALSAAFCDDATRARLAARLA